MEFINSGITVFGFIVSFFLLRSSFSQEIQKQKTDIYLNQLSEMPMTILKMLDSVIFWIIPPFSPSESGRNSPVEYGSYSPDMIGGSLNRHPIKIPIPA